MKREPRLGPNRGSLRRSKVFLSGTMTIIQNIFVKGRHFVTLRGSHILKTLISGGWCRGKMASKFLGTWLGDRFVII
jgi:hypothetical protein